MEYTQHKKRFVSNAPAFLGELEARLSDIEQDAAGMEDSIKMIIRVTEEFLEDARDACWHDHRERLIAERRECVCVRWSDGVDTIVSGSVVTQELRDHIQWRTEKYASKGEDLTFRIEIGDRRDLLK